MLSYQHIYHAGNSADIFKHLTLTLILDSLSKKDKPFTVFDSHAGNGFYSFEDERTEKTGEKNEGILKLLKNSAVIENDDKAFDIFLKYLKIQRLYLNKKLYAGSPEIERLSMKSQDHLNLCELHPESVAALKKNMGTPTLTEKKDLPQIHIHERDGWETINALIPPKYTDGANKGKTMRGLVFMDPSFEDESDYLNCAKTFDAMHKKWNSGIFALWYPVLTKKKSLLADMKRKIIATAGSAPTTPVFDIQFLTKEESDIDRTEKAAMIGSGMLIVNPPFQIEEKLRYAVEVLGKI